MTTTKWTTVDQKNRYPEGGLRDAAAERVWIREDYPLSAAHAGNRPATVVCVTVQALTTDPKEVKMANENSSKINRFRQFKLSSRILDSACGGGLWSGERRYSRSPVKIICKGGKMLDKPLVTDAASRGWATGERADELRFNANYSERSVADGLCHIGFIHSVPKCGYYLDFYNPEHRVCVEIDGAYHLERKQYDRRRDTVLWRNGITTWRFSADVATENPGWLCREVEARLHKKESDEV